MKNGLRVLLLICFSAHVSFAQVKKPIDINASYKQSGLRPAIATAQKKGGKSKTVKDPNAELIRKFYSAYIKVNSVQDDYIPDAKNIVDTLKKYCTIALVRTARNGNREFDPIIQGQDYDTTCVPTIEVVKTDPKNNVFQVCYHQAYNDTKHCINVALVQENKKWKLDRTW